MINRIFCKNLIRVLSNVLSNVYVCISFFICLIYIEITIAINYRNLIIELPSCLPKFIDKLRQTFN